MERVCIEVVIIGQGIFPLVVNDLNQPNQDNYGKLGNLKTLTLYLDPVDESPVNTRRSIIEKLKQDKRYLKILYDADDWHRIFVLDRFALKT